MFALLFFLSSYGPAVSVEMFFEGTFQGILMMLAIVMVAIAVYDREDRVLKREKKSHLLKKLKKQKDILRKRFDLQRNLTAKSQDVGHEPAQSAINFANEDATVSTIVEKSSPEEKIVDSQMNLARILIEGEDISSFPPEWQEFLIENEGKEPIEKLNKILENGFKNEK